MKLLTKTSIYYFVLSLIIFVAGGIIFYVQIKNIIDEDFTENIFLEKDRIIEFVAENQSIPTQTFSFGDQITFSKVEFPISEHLEDTTLYNQLEEEYQPYRQLNFGITLQDQHYAVCISKSMFDSEDLLEGIGLGLVMIAAFMLILIFFLFRAISKKLWNPFYVILNRLENFDLNKTQEMQHSDSSTLEFLQLNCELDKMYVRLRKDYSSLKEFTENASHEIQTPLSIIRLKLESLMQSSGLDEKGLSLANEAFEATVRLSKLNQSLLLLTKIENQQFHDRAKIDIAKSVELKLEQYHELILFKELKMQSKLSHPIEVEMNAQLADILISNLIGNAIKHNLQGGKLIIETFKNMLKISNSGNPPSENLNDHFDRFRKANQSSDSLGLGLSIAKKICDSYHYEMEYVYKDDMYAVTIYFQQLQNSSMD